MEYPAAFSKEEINEAQLVLHHASQLLAIAGKYLIEEKDDDSHTNLGWNQESSSFIGHIIHNRARVGLDVSTLTLKVFGPSNLELAALSLSGKTKEEALTWLKQALQLKQINAEAMKPEMHYEIPEHETNYRKSFPEIAPELLEELARHRTLADQVCESISNKYKYASGPRTWPHHFDHGTYIPFKHDLEGSAIQSFSVGYAVADSIIDEPYFYVTQWKDGGKIDYSTAPKLAQGEWLPEKLKGAALALSVFMTPGKIDMDKITSFLQTTIQWSKNI